MEELKLIMQTLAGLGETAKEGFIWWLVIDKLVPTILWGAFGGGLIGLAMYIARRVTDAYHIEDRRLREKEASIQAVRVIRGVLGVYKYPRLMRDTDFYTDADMNDTVEAVRAVKKVASAKQEQA